MALSIFWTDEAIETFDRNVQYLNEQWNSEVMSNFLDRVDMILTNVSQNPNLYPIYRHQDEVHKCVINKHISLFYRVTPTRIDLITF